MQFCIEQKKRIDFDIILFSFHFQRYTILKIELDLYATLNFNLNR